MANTNPFDDMLTAGVRAGKMPARTQAAREWYRDQAKHYGHKIRQGGKEAGRKDYAKINEKKLIQSDPTRLTNMITPGNMYMFMYDAKMKDELPFWDKFPLIFPFRVQPDRFWGINLHYLPLPMRAQLMDALYTIRNNSRYDESTKLKISYQLLQSSSRFKFFKPCVKQYLFTQTRSQFSYVFPAEWDTALFLPVEKFQKASKTQVWKASKQKYNLNS